MAHQRDGSAQVAPVLEQGATLRKVYLPGAGPWYDTRTGAVPETDEAGTFAMPVDMDSVPSFLQGGHILPIRVRMRTSHACMHL